MMESEPGVRIHVRFARPGLTLAAAAVAEDGALVAGAGTELRPSVVRSLLEAGIDSVRIREADAVAPWEREPELDEAMAALAARFAHAGADPVLAALRAALARRMRGAAA